MPPVHFLQVKIEFMIPSHISKRKTEKKNVKRFEELTEKKLTNTPCSQEEAVIQVLRLTRYLFCGFS